MTEVLETEVLDTPAKGAGSIRELGEHARVSRERRSRAC